jgi:SAM-dependent methyltransferase
MSESSQPLLTWQEAALGRALIGAEARLLSAAFDDVFGFEALQLGAWGRGRELLATSRIRGQRVVADRDTFRPGVDNGSKHGADVVASLTHLPISRDAIDAVLLPHSLEYSPDPHAVLREADRILVGEGHLLVMGFSPTGLWGLRAAAMRPGFPPGLRRPLSEGRVRDWLELLGYDIIRLRRYLFRLPTRPRGASASANVINGILHRGWLYPFPASAYLIKARKRVYTVTPIKPKPLRERLTVLGGRQAAPVARRQGWR